MCAKEVLKRFRDVLNRNKHERIVGCSVVRMRQTLIMKKIIYYDKTREYD